MILAALTVLSFHISVPPQPVEVPFPDGVILRWRAPVERILWARRPNDKGIGTLTIRRNGTWSVAGDEMRERGGKMSGRQIAWLIGNVGKLDQSVQVACVDVPQAGGPSGIVMRPEPRGPCRTYEPHKVLVSPATFVDPLRDTERTPEKYFVESDLDGDLLLSWYDGRTGKRLTVSRDGRVELWGGAVELSSQLDQSAHRELERLLARTEIKTRRETTARKCLISGVEWSALVVRRRDRVSGTTWDDCLQIPNPGLQGLVERLSKLAGR